MALDMRTLSAVLGVVFLSLALILGVIWFTDRRRREVGFAAGAYVGLGLCDLLLSLRGQAPNSLSVGAANLFECAGYLLLWRSVRVPYRPAPLGAEIKVLVVTTAAIGLFEFAWPAMSNRVIVGSTFGLVISILVVREFLRAPDLALRGDRVVVLLAFAGLALLMPLRIGLTALPDEMSGYMQTGSLQALVLLVRAALCVALACGTLWSSFARVDDALIRHNRELETAKNDADRANRAKSTFLASVAHEFRTPVSAVLGIADLLLASTLTGEQRRQLTMLRDAESSLTVFVDDLLDLTNLEVGKIRFAPAPIRLVELVDGVIEMLRSAAEAKHLELRTDLSANLPAWIEVDPARLRQILVNLVHNAIKFTDQGQIIVAARREAAAGREQLRFEVSDSGVGIRGDCQDLLFKEFSQITRSAGQRGGIGLGLAICRRLAEAMGGSIGVRSAAGAGSTFWFTIDLVEAAPRTLVAEAGPSNEQRRLRILVAEDDIANQLVIDAMLRLEGHDVSVVGTGSAALEAVQKSAFDLLIMDIDMPTMNGIVASRAIRQLRAPVRDTPIVALTAYAMPTIEWERCRRAGMNDYLKKPIDRKLLRAAIGKWSGAVFEQPRDPPRVAASPVVDLTTLRALEDQIGHGKLLALVEAFHREISEAISTMEDGARPDVARRAHKLISASGYLGCVELTRRSQALIDAIASEAPRLAPFLVQFKNAAFRTQTAIERRYPELDVPPPLGFGPSSAAVTVPAEDAQGGAERVGLRFQPASAANPIWRAVHLIDRRSAG